MGIRGCVTACVVAGTAALGAAGAAAEPAPSPLGWHAPAVCPDAADARARVEHRLGEPIDRFDIGLDVAITSAPHGYVAQVGARTLTGDTCEDLTDAVAIVVARLATEAPRRDAPPAPPEWGGGLRGSWISGVGGVPSVGMGGELAAYLRRGRLLVEVAASDWGQGGASARLAPATVDVGLLTTTLRVGYAPEPKAIRGWLAADVGRMTGAGALGTTAPTAAWIAIGPGFAVVWPIAPRLRLVGTIEVLATVTRARFGQDEGMPLYEPSPVSARTTLGLELGWR